MQDYTLIHTLDPNEPETAINALHVVQEPSLLILAGNAKRTFAKAMAIVMNNPNSEEFFNRWDWIEGYRCAMWDEGDMCYLGCLGGRVWFGRLK